MIAPMGFTVVSSSFTRTSMPVLPLIDEIKDGTL